MPSESPQRRVLLVDDDPRLLAVLQPLFADCSGGHWDIQTAGDAATALSILQSGLVDLLVLDVQMPPVDGIQFLRLLQHRFPGLAKVVLTGDGTGAHRQNCLNNGADLYLEKPRVAAGWTSIYAALDQLTRLKAPDAGFRGVLQRVGLQDVLQMECLARNSSVFEITDGTVSGRIFIQDGSFIHAEAGARSGEEALHALLGLRHGEFNLRAFTEPPRRTIEGQWEFLLMEAARLRDESWDAAAATDGDKAAADLELPAESLAAVSDRPGEAPALPAAASGHVKPRIDEVLLCSVRGDLWHEWQVSRPEARVQLLTLLRHKSAQVSEGLPLGGADQLEIDGGSQRIVIHLRPDCSLLVRASRAPAMERAVL